MMWFKRIRKMADFYSNHVSLIDLTDYPEWGDEDDEIGIDPERVWFCFNDKKSWTEFGRVESGTEELKESELFEKITIGDTNGR